MYDFDKTLNAILSVDPDAEAIDYQGNWSTWGELTHTIHSLNQALESLNLNSDTRVGVMLRNRPPHVAALLGTICSSRCIVTVNPLFPDDKLSADIETLDLPVIVGLAEDLNRDVVASTIKQAGCAVIELPAELGNDVQINNDQISNPNARKDAPGIIIEMLTSGTTGTPKRIPLKRAKFEDSFVASLAFEKGRSASEVPTLRKGTQMLTAPFAHIGGVWHCVNAFMAGRKGCLLDKFRVEDWSDAVVRHRPKVVSAPPSALRMLLDASLPADVFSSLAAIRSGTAPLDPAIVDEFLSRYDLPILQNYGATEFAGSVAGWNLRDFRDHYSDKVGSVGKITPPVEGRIVDMDTGEPLPFGEEGILELRGPQLASDDWLKTTDRATMDEDNYLWIKGRADNAIIRGGFKVHADDVVKALHQHPAVREASVVGLKDRRLGEVPAAAIILKQGTEAPSSDELNEFLRSLLVPYQVPTRYTYVEELPRTPSLKPAIPEVKALFEMIDNE